MAYDLPGTAQARILWGTGRGNYQRTGYLPPDPGTLESSSKGADPLQAGPGDVLTYTVILRNPGATLHGVRMTDTLPAEVGYLGDLWASSGSYGEAGGIITWTGSVAGAVTVTFGVTVSQPFTTPYAIVNTAWIDDGQGKQWQRQATIVVSGYRTYLPVVARSTGW
jgi:uncharacterized repeat protein (TIGR01451 family)